MNEIYAQITHYANSLWRRRWYALATAWVVCLIGWAVVAAMPNVYVSSGRIYVDTANVLAPLLRNLIVSNDVRQEVRLLQQTLLSRPNLERAVRMVDLDITVDTPADMQALVDSVRSRTKLTSSVVETDLFSVSFESDDPRQARDVVQALITIFVESSLKGSQGLDQARDFIERQMADIKVQLDVAEDRLAKFKLENVDLLPGRTSFLEKAQQARDSLAQSEVQLKEAIAQRAVLRAEIAKIDELLKVGAEGADGLGPPTGDHLRILQLEAQLEQMLSLYTSEHPDVKWLQRRLEALREEENEELLNLPIGSEEGELESAGNDSGYGIPNPVYANTHAQLLQLETTVKLLEDRVERLRKTVAVANEKSAKVPLVETELGRLNHDYTALKSKYQEFASRLDTAMISEGYVTSGDKVQFRIVDPPKVPAFPSGPNRPLFLTVVLFVGLGAGLGLAMVLVILDDTYSTAASLRDEFGVPVFGTISNLQSFGDRLWSLSRATTTIVAVVGIFATYGFLQIVEQNSGLNNSGFFEFSPNILNRALNLVQQTFAGVMTGGGF
ncbi:MAG: XrtA system polysaccharide chain length determinant [Pseudomonadota bacterium]